MTIHHTLKQTLIHSLLLGLMLGLQGCGGSGGGAPTETLDAQQTSTSQSTHGTAQSAPSTTQQSATPATETATLTAITMSSDATAPNQIADDDAAQPTLVAESETLELTPPQITFSPASVSAISGQSHTFNVSAQSTETLHYQWRLNGTAIPDAVLPYFTLNNLNPNDAGQYDVVITSAGGSVTSQTAQLTIIIDRSASLSWETPLLREDGSPLTANDITGYRIYHSTQDGSLETHYDIDSETTTLALENLTSGTHFFAITAIDQAGLESDLSNIVSKQVL